MRAPPVILACLVAGLLLAAPASMAQSFLSPGEATFEVAPDGTDTVTFTIKNPVQRNLTGFARVQGTIAQAVTLEAQEFTVPAAGERTLDLHVDASRLKQGIYDGTLEIVLVDPATGDTQELTSHLSTTVQAELLLFGTWDNPMPAPLDDRLGLFILETSIWVLIAFAGMKIADKGTRVALRTAPRWIKNEVVSKFTTPLFALIVFSGLRGAWRLFPETGVAGILSGLLDALIVLTAAFFLYRVTDAILVYLGEQVAPRTEAKWDDVVLPVARKVAFATVAGFAFIYALQSLGLDLGFLVAGGLVVGLVLSNSLGPTLQNLFSGLFIMIDRPFEEGQDIRLDTGEVCNVRRIGLRSTRLYFYRNHEYIIAPNKDLESARIVNLNYPDNRYKIHIQVGVAYGSPLETVRELLTEVAEAHPEVYMDDELRSGVFFDDFGESALLFRLVVFVTDVSERFRIASEIRDMIDDRFDEHGITIPFPQRTLWNHEIDRPATGPGSYADDGHGQGPSTQASPEEASGDPGPADGP